MRRRYMLRLSYMGNNYRGSQKHVTGYIQDVDSIQGALECSLHKIKKVLVNNPTVILAGRTDAGVHALNTAAHLDMELRPGLNLEVLDTDNIVRSMNRFLIHGGHEIRVYTCHEVSKDFHARFSATSRSYMYRFLIAKDFKDYRIPIGETNRTLHLHFDTFDIEKMRRGIELFKGTKDFRTFSAKSLRSKSGEDEYKRSFVRTLDIKMEEALPLMPCDPLSNNFNYYNLHFTSRGFLYNQIRRIVGALIALGIRRVEEEDIITMLQVPSHDNWNTNITPAPSHGLYLANVVYDEDITKDISGS